MIGRAARVVLVLVGQLVACAAFPSYPRLYTTQPGPLPDSLTVIHYDGVYPQWWKDVERCAKKHVPMRGVTFYMAPHSMQGFQIPGDGTWYDGMAYADRGVIVLAQHVLLDSMVVRHEMLHLIASPRNHDPHYFLDLCKGVVGCGTECALEAVPDSTSR